MRKNTVTRSVSAFMLTTAFTFTWGGSAQARPRPPAFLSYGTEAAAPRGFVEMCESGAERQLCSATQPRTADSSVVTTALPSASAPPVQPAMIGPPPSLMLVTPASDAFDGDPSDPAGTCANDMSITHGGRFVLAHVSVGIVDDCPAAMPAIAGEPPVIIAISPLIVSPAPRAMASPQPLAAMSDADMHKMLKRVNRYVNGRVRQETDLAIYGIGELWRRSGVGPAAKGDCEDIAIEKRLELIAEGFPPERLAFAVVYSFASGLHTVLIARTGSGDMVLDSRSPYVQPWAEVNYTWLGVQSMNDPMRWQSVSAS